MTLPTVLVVDDNADLRFVLRLGLERDGRFGAVREAENGKLAIEATESDAPDLIVLDEMMPVMSGSDALPALRRLAPNARIVMFSATAGRHRDELVARADAFVGKGGDLRDLFEVLLPVGADLAS